MSWKLIIVILFSSLSFRAQVETIKIKKETKPEFESGKILYKKLCSQCHSETDQLLTAPSLIGITKKRKITWLILWTRSSTELIQSGDKLAVETYRKYGSGQPDFKELSNEEIVSIFKFTETFKSKPKSKK